jgi:hypothetical protein
VSLDVEYAHMRLADGAEVSFPAWVALLDQHCSVLLKTYIKPEVRLPTNSSHSTQVVGGRQQASFIAGVRRV